MKKELQEFVDQVRECDKLIEEQEELREALYKRIDEILEQEEQDIISLSK
jgi:superfamily I DNA/RNA helicase